MCNIITAQFLSNINELPFDIIKSKFSNLCSNQNLKLFYQLQLCFRISYKIITLFINIKYIHCYSN